MMENNLGSKSEQPKYQEYNKHLLEGVKPIVTSWGTIDDYEKYAKMFDVINPLYHNLGLENVTEISWFDSVAEMRRKRYLNAGTSSYVMSEVDGENKKALGYQPCTGLLVVGIEETTGKNISFLTHQLSMSALGGARELFVDDLETRIEQLKRKCKKGTIDAVIIGGDYSGHYGGRYIDSIKLIGQEVEKHLGFEPTVINGPKNSAKDVDDVYYDNDNRRLYLIRSRVNPAITGFKPSEVDKYKDKF